MLCGKAVVLVPVEWDDIELLHRWYSDPEVLYWASGGYPDTIMSRYELEESFEKELRSDSSRRFIIETFDGVKIGLITYKRMNRQLHSTTIGLFIGEKEMWGQGLGTDALRTFLCYLFEQWNLNRVELETFAGNLRAIHAYEKCGFVIEGRIRDGFYVHGEYQERIIMGILRRDFEQVKLTW